MGRMRRRRSLLVGALLLVLAVAALGAFAVLRPRGDVSNPQVDFVPPPAVTPEPREPKVRDTFRWPMYGYTKDHTRAFKPAKPLRGPFKRVWRHRAPALLEFPPSLDGPLLFQLADNGRLAALVKRTGRVKWKRSLGRLAASTPAAARGRLYVTLLEGGRRAGQGRIVSLHQKDGKILWERTLPSRSESSPLEDRGRIYFGTEDGTVFCLRARTGKVLWTYRAAGAVKGSPTLAGGNLYFGDYGGHVQAVRASDGKRIWDSSHARALLRGGEHYATAAVAYGRVYIGATDGRMYSLSAKDGRLAWAHQTGRYVYSSAAVDTVPGVGPTVFFGSYDGNFYALDARSGRVRWSKRSGGRISGSPTIIGDTVYFSDLGTSTTMGLKTANGDVAFRLARGAYDPAVSDGRYLFLTARFSISAFRPVRAAGADAAKSRAEKRRGERRRKRAAARRRGKD